MLPSSATQPRSPLVDSTCILRLSVVIVLILFFHREALLAVAWMTMKPPRSREGIAKRVFMDPAILWRKSFLMGMASDQREISRKKSDKDVDVMDRDAVRLLLL